MNTDTSVGAIAAVLAELATGHSWSGGSGSISLLPVIGSLLTMILLRAALGRPASFGMVGAAVGLGTLFWFAAEAWGLTVAVPIWWTAAIAIRASLRGARGSLGGNPPD